MRRFYKGSRTERELASVLIDRMKKLADKYMDIGASPGNKVAIRMFMQKFAVDGLSVLTDELRVIIDEIDDIRGQYEPLKASIADLSSQERKLMREVDDLKMERSKQADKFTDPKAREAFRLYTEVMSTGQRDNGYERCRRITAAGAIAAAYLGLTRYGGGVSDADDEKERQ